MNDVYREAWLADLLTRITEHRGTGFRQVIWSMPYSFDQSSGHCGAGWLDG
jgi:hypothetical protein